MSINADVPRSGEQKLAKPLTVPEPVITVTAVNTVAAPSEPTPTPLTAAEEEEKRQRREIRMKERIEKKKRKREMRLLAMAKEVEAKETTSTSIPDHQRENREVKPISVEGPRDDIQRQEKKKLKISIKTSSLSSSKDKQVSKVPSSSSIMESKPSAHTTEKVTKPAKLSKISFPINEECTALQLSPSGRHVIAGFTDGTLRLYDTTGRLWQPFSSGPIKSEMDHLFDSDSEDEGMSPSKQTAHRAKQRMVASKSFQNYGAVACQIHARGVITSLLMDIDCCEDGRFAFGGVLRGSTELVAVDLSQIEKYHDDYLDKDGNVKGAKRDILDLIKVYRNSDAKLKGFGACIRLKNTDKLEYRLFTGKGIKVRH